MHVKTMTACKARSRYIAASGKAPCHCSAALGKAQCHCSAAVLKRTDSYDKIIKYVGKFYYMYISLILLWERQDLCVK